MAVINIHKLKTRVHIGVSAEERAFPSVIVLHLALECGIADAAKSDSISDTIDYEQAIVTIRELSARNEYCLLERFIQQCAVHLLDRFDSLTAVSVTAKKDIFTDVAAVSVSERFER